MTCLVKSPPDRVHPAGPGEGRGGGGGTVFVGASKSHLDGKRSVDQTSPTVVDKIQLGVLIPFVVIERFSLSSQHRR